MAGPVSTKCIEVKNVWMLDLDSMSIYLCICMCANSWVSVHTCASTHGHNLAVSISDVWYMCSCVICPGLRTWSLRTPSAFPHPHVLPIFLYSSTSWSLVMGKSELFYTEHFPITALWENSRYLGGGVWAIFLNSKRSTHWTWHPAQTFPRLSELVVLFLLKHTVHANFAPRMCLRETFGCGH